MLQFSGGRYQHSLLHIATLRLIAAGYFCEIRNRDVFQLLLASGHGSCDPDHRVGGLSPTHPVSILANLVVAHWKVARLQLISQPDLINEAHHS
jgi:hypothetical protein